MKDKALAIGAAGTTIVCSFIIAPNSLGLLGASLAVISIAIAFVDYRHFVIPDAFNALAFGLAMLQAALQNLDAIPTAVATATLRGVIFALVLLGIRQLYARVRHRQGLGLGDVKLAAVAGAWLEWSMMPVAIEIAAMTALSAYFLRQLLTGERISANSRLPFGLFFAPAIWMSWAFQTFGSKISDRAGSQPRDLG